MIMNLARDLSLRRARQSRSVACIDIDDGRVLEDLRAGGDRGLGKPQAVIERMEMPGATFAQGAMIDLRAKAFFELGLVQDLRVGIAERIPFVFPLVELVELRGLGDRMQIAPFEVAIDLVFARCARR